MGKTFDTSDADTGVALDRTPGVAATDHNLLASLRMRDGEFWKLISPGGIVLANPARCQFNSTSKRITVPTAAKPIIALIKGMMVELSDDHEESGTADSGSTTSVVSSGLESADNNWWKYAWVVWVTGSNAGSVRRVDTYDDTSKTLTWTSPLGSSVSNGDTFVVTRFYISGFTVGVLNYVFMTVNAWTPLFGVAEFYAKASSTPNDVDDLLVATATLDGSGTVTASDNDPTGADRLLAPIIGRYDPSVQSVQIHPPIDPAGSVTYYATHDELAMVGDTDVALSDADFSFEILEHYKSDRVRLTVTNDGAYSKGVTVTVTRTGCKKITLDD